MKKFKNKILFGAITVLGLCGVMVSVFITDIKMVMNEWQKPSPLAMDENHKVIALFESKIFINNEEYPVMPMTAIIGGKAGYGLASQGDKQLVYGVRAFKTKDCASDEIYAEFEFGERLFGKTRIYTSAIKKVKNRQFNEITIEDTKYGEHLKMVTKPYFGPAEKNEEQSSYPLHLINSAHATVTAHKPSIYQTMVRVYSKGTVTTSAGVVIQENKMGIVKNTTDMPNGDSLVKEMNIQVFPTAPDKVYTTMLYKNLENNKEDVMLFQREVALGKEEFFDDDRFSVTITKYK